MKKIIITLGLIILLTLNTNVYSADTEYMLKKYDVVPNVYVTKINSEHKIYDYMYIIARNSDKKPVYCIEPGVHIKDSAIYKSESLNNGINNYLTKEELKKIETIAYYGYGYKDENVNHTDKKWYAVTQSLIWKVAPNNHQIYFTNYLQGPKVDKYPNEVTELKNLINNHNKRPDLNNEYTINLNESLNLSDSLLKEYSISKSNNNIELDKNNNTLNLKGLKKGTTNITLTKTFDYYDEPSSIYLGGNSQKLFNIGNPDPINIEIKINITGSKIKVNKIDKETNKPILKYNFNFKIKNLNTNEYICNNNECIYTTNNGFFTTDYLPYGKYQIEEQESNIKEYNFNQSPLIIELNNSETKEVNFYNTPSYPTLTISKLGESYTFNNNDIIYSKIPLKSAEFEIYNEEDIYYPDNTLMIPKNTLIKKFITTEDNTIINDLPYGKYRLIEIKSPDNYIPSSEPVLFNLNKDLNVTIENQLINSTFIIKKIDEKNIPIKNVKYEIKTINNELVYLGQTNNEGKIIIENLPIGKYQYKEISTIDGYLIDNNTYYIDITENNKTITKTHINKQIKATVTINKIDSLTNEKIPNALINILDSNNNIILRKLTDNKGQIIIDNLPYGTYKYYEEIPPQDYLLNNNIYEFKITNNEPISLKLLNERVIVPNTYKNSINYSIYLSLYLIFKGLLLIYVKK